MNVKAENTIIELERFVPYQVIFLADRISRRTSAIAKRHGGLNLSSWRVLAALAEAPGRTAAEIVAVTPMDKGIVSRSVKNLIDSGLIRREASQDDGRLAHLKLTAKGMRRYQAIAAEIREVEGAMLAHLSGTDRETLSRAIADMIAVLSPQD